LPTEQDRENHGLDRHNGTGLWQGRLRIGAFDTSLVKYSLDVLGGVDEIAMTHLDQRDEFSEFAYRYYGPKEFVDESGFLTVRMPASEEYQRNMAQNLISKVIAPTYLDQPSDAESFVSEIATRLHTPITILSEGPCISDKTRL
jgi:adenylosuccinate synthase